MIKLAVCEFLVKDSLMRYWMTGCLKVCFLWCLEMRRGYFLTRFEMATLGCVFYLEIGVVLLVE